MFNGINSNFLAKILTKYIFISSANSKSVPLNISQLISFYDSIQEKYNQCLEVCSASAAKRKIWRRCQLGSNQICIRCRFCFVYWRIKDSSWWDQSKWKNTEIERGSIISVSSSAEKQKEKCVMPAKCSSSTLYKLHCAKTPCMGDECVCAMVYIRSPRCTFGSFFLCHPSARRHTFKRLPPFRFLPPSI